MENLTLEEIELALTAISQWEREFRISGENWDDVDALEKKLERMKERLLTQRAGDGSESEQTCMCDIQGSSNCDIHGANRRA